MRKKITFIGLTVVMIAITSACNRKPTVDASFTRADSLTETYLALQDTMLQVWNTMIYDDNRKIEAMHDLLHELTESRPEKRDDLKDYERRLDELPAMRYDQRSLADAELVTEYDFVSNSLVSELISEAESHQQFAYNTTLQKLVDSIRSADQRVMNYRAEYDEIALRFNRFVERNQSMLRELEPDSLLEKKPLFQMAAE